jgi:hypothetical protein
VKQDILKRQKQHRAQINGKFNYILGTDENKQKSPTSGLTVTGTVRI